MVFLKKSVWDEVCAGKNGTPHGATGQKVSKIYSPKNVPAIIIELICCNGNCIYLI